MTTRVVKQTVPLEEQQFRPGKPQLGRTPAPDNPTARSQKDSFNLFLDTKQQVLTSTLPCDCSTDCKQKWLGIYLWRNVVGKLDYTLDAPGLQ